MRARLFLLALLLAGCSQREHANPLDPANPHTGGGPAGFVAIAGDRRIDLRWVPISGSQGISGFHLYRQAGADPQYHLISGLLPPTTSSYADLGALNGLLHRYQLNYVSQNGTDRTPPATDVATPGRARAWVVDTGRHALFRITPDGRRVVTTYGGFDGPRSVGVDSVTGQVWVSDSFDGHVAIINPATGLTINLPGLGVPSALAIDPLLRVTWVCDELDDKLWSFDPSGQPSGNPIEPLLTPTGVAVDVFDRSVVICEYDGNRVRRHALDHSLLGTLSMTSPTRVAIDSVTRRIWVTSFLGKSVLRVPPSFDTIEGTTPGFQGPIGIAIDARRGRIWVADAVAGHLVALDRNGTVQFRVTGMTSVNDVAVDQGTGEVWAVLPDRSELVHLSSGGTILSRLAGFSQPLGVAVDPGR